MERPHFFDRKKSFYPDVSSEDIDSAKTWLKMIAHGDVNNLNIDRNEAQVFLKKIEEGTLSESSVLGFSYNYRDLIESDNQKGK